MIAGFGLGALGLALLLPAPEVAALPPPASPAPEPGIANAPGARSWPASFGTPPLTPAPAAPEPPVEEAYEDIEDDTDYLPYEDHDYRLRGMVAQTDGPDASSPAGGWALIESEIGVEVVRVGSELSGGETIIEITPHGVILQGFGPEFLLSFSDDDGYDDFDSFDDTDDTDDDTFLPRDGP